MEVKMNEQLEAVCEALDKLAEAVINRLLIGFKNWASLRSAATLQVDRDTNDGPDDC